MPAPALAQSKPTERSVQKQAAESERAALRDRLAGLKREINRTETAKSRAADGLADSEAAISDANRSLRDLAGEQSDTQARLAALERERIALMRVVDSNKRQLARLLREQYMAGSEDRVKLLLSGQDPNRINRDLQMFGYVSKAQASLIENLKRNLQGVEKNQAEMINAKAELDEIAQEQRDAKALLEREKGTRNAMLAELSDKLASQRKEAGNIARDEERLSGLVNQLARLIEQQRRAELAEAEKRRREERLAAEQRKQQRQRAAEQLAHERAAAREALRAAQREARLQAQRRAAKPGQTVNPDAIDNDEDPAVVAARNRERAAEKAADQAAELLARKADEKARQQDDLADQREQKLEAARKGTYPASFPALRGQLHLPLEGELAARFGARRGDGPSWKGLFIRASEGADVKAVAGGRVVFAEWLRGFGNLIIVDHGSEYLTIYGNNQAVLKRPGDAVKAGDVIASAGNSGGNEQSGLYFEMRHQGRAFDPLGWVTTR
ncbi:MAG: peptidoglycan DD-metalloendopeptidase family protein [Janthinobacterium lividum]